MDKNNMFYSRKKFFLHINKSSSDFYGTLTYRNFIRENLKNEPTKILSPFTINQEMNRDLIDQTHRRILHSKIKSNPKYKKLEIECYSYKKDKEKNKLYNSQKDNEREKKKEKEREREIFLTNDNNLQKTLKKSRNKDNYLNIYNTYRLTNYKIGKKKNMYPESSTKMYMNNYFFDTNRNIKDFINQRRFAKKLKYINKLKMELKEKRENEIECDLNLLEYDRISLLKSQFLLEQFETDRNHYYRHLLNELMIHKQILLKLKLKKSILEGKVSNLKKKIDDLKNKSNLLKEYKHFLLCVKKHASSFDKYFYKTIDNNNEKKNEANISNNNNKDKLILDKKNLINKRTSNYMPILKQNTYTVKKKLVNNQGKNLRDIKKRVTYNEKQLLGEKFDNNSFNHQDINSYSEIFESSYEFNSKMNKIEDTLFTLIYKNNQIRRELVELKFIKKKELNSIKTNKNMQTKIKLYEELLNNYKDYNNDLNKKLNSLIKGKDNVCFINMIHKKTKLIINNINNSNNNNKEFKKYECIFEKIKQSLTINTFKLKKPFIFEGIKLIEWLMTSLMIEIKECSKNYEQEQLIKNIRYIIEKEKKSSHDKHYKDEIERIIKMNKMSKKMNKFLFISRKVPDKVDFSKIKKIDKK